MPITSKNASHVKERQALLSRRVKGLREVTVTRGSRELLSTGMDCGSNKLQQTALCSKTCDNNKNKSSLFIYNVLKERQKKG
jgi:hypothetical protein